MGCARVPLIQPIAVQDEFVSGIDHIEMLGTSCARFYLYVDHVPDDGEPPERVLVRQVVVPLDCLPKAVRKTLRFMALRGVEVGCRELSRALS